MATARKLSDGDVAAVFRCIHENLAPPASLTFRIVPVGPDGMKLSPPPYEYEDGLYVLLKPDKKRKSTTSKTTALLSSSAGTSIVPSNLRHLIMEEMPPATCQWGLSGPQFPQQSTVQQRYCYPRGDVEYANTKGGALWTKYDSNGKEDLNFRLLHVYFSAKRVLNKGLSTTPSIPPIPKKLPDVVKTASLLNSPEPASVSSSCLSSSSFSDINDDSAALHHKDKRGRGGAPLPLLAYDSTSKLNSSPVRSKNGPHATSGSGDSSTTTYTTQNLNSKMRQVTPMHDVRALNSANKGGSGTKPFNHYLLSRGSPNSTSKFEGAKSRSPAFHAPNVRGGTPYHPYHYHAMSGHHPSNAYHNHANMTHPGKAPPSAFSLFRRPSCHQVQPLNEPEPYWPPTSRARMNSAPSLRPPVLSNDEPPSLNRSRCLLPKRSNHLTPHEDSSSAAEVALLEFEAFWTDPLPIDDTSKVQEEKPSASDNRSLEEVKAFNAKLQVLHSLLVEKIMETPSKSKQLLLDALQTWAKHVVADPLATHNTTAHTHTANRTMEQEKFSPVSKSSTTATGFPVTHVKFNEANCPVRLDSFSSSVSPSTKTLKSASGSYSHDVHRHS